MRKRPFPAIPFFALPAVLVLALVVAACGGDDDAEPANTPQPSPAASPSPSAAATSAPSMTSATAAPSTAITATSPTAATTVAGTPPPEVTAFPPRRADGATQTDRCGNTIVVREAVKSADSKFPMADRVTIKTADGVLITQLTNDEPFVSITVDWCYDIDGDGLPELSVATYSGGAHCCTTQAIYAFDGPKSEVLLQYNAGNAGSLTPKELNGKPPVELTGLDDRLAYFADLPYVASRFMVTVYADRSGNWVEATRDFPQVVQQYRSQMTTDFARCPGDPSSAQICQQGLGLAIMAESLVLGDWPAYSATLTIPAEVKSWLDAHQAEVQTLISQPKPQSS